MDVHALAVPSQAIRSIDTDETFWLSVPVQLYILKTVLDGEAELSPLLHLYLYFHNVTEQNNGKDKTDLNTHAY